MMRARSLTVFRSDELRSHAELLTVGVSGMKKAKQLLLMSSIVFVLSGCALSSARPPYYWRDPDNPYNLLQKDKLEEHKAAAHGK